MKTHNMLLSLLAAATIGPAAVRSAEPAKEARFFEMRTYFAAPGKLEALQARFRDHTVKLFEKHGMTNIGYWLPLTNTENKLVYLLAYPDRDAREKSWKAFSADPDWQAARKASEKDGRLVLKADVLFLNPTDFSPAVTVSASGEPRLFELRQYTCEPGRQPALLARFREHTLGLFAKHGMTNVGYWTPADKDKGADDTLVYLLAHKSLEAHDASFKEFRADPEWVSVKKASEDKAGGPLTVTNGVKSTLLLPADFSPMK